MDGFLVSPSSAGLKGRWRELRLWRTVSGSGSLVPPRLRDLAHAAGSCLAAYGARGHTLCPVATVPLLTVIANPLQGRQTIVGGRLPLLTVPRAKPEHHRNR